jgi:excisionase family DNA binding protein
MPDPRPQREATGDPLLLTPEEAAKLLRVGRTTVYALMKSGDLHPIHIGRSCRLSRAELERYVRRLEAPAPVPSRSSARKRTTTDQGSLFELRSTSVEDPARVDSRPETPPETSTLVPVHLQRRRRRDDGLR